MLIYTIFTLFVDRHNIKLSTQELILVVLLNPFILGDFIIIFIRLFLFKNNVEWVPIDRAYYISDKDE